MLPQKIRCLFFDLDGTLINTIPLLYDTYLAFLAGFGKSGSREEFEEFNGPSLKEIIAMMKQRYGLYETEEALLHSYHSELIKQYSILRMEDSILEMLVNIKQAGYRLYLITSAAESLVKDLIEKNSLEKIFEGMTFGEEVTHSKPHPEIYNLSVRKFGLDKSVIAVVEDSVNGISSAKSAGLFVIAVTGTHSESELHTSKADMILHEISSFKAILN
jgi:HAD superfamily hydrolase (TIGR01509 family)